MLRFMKMIFFSFFLTTTAFAACNPEYAEKGCTKKPSSFPEIIIYAGFAHDYGCMGEVFCMPIGLMGIEKEINPMLILGETQAWKNAQSPEQKAAILLKWIEEVLHWQDRIIHHSSDAVFENGKVQNFDSIRNQIPVITEPSISYPQKNQIVVTLWVNVSRSTMRPVIEYKKITYSVGKQGIISIISVSEAFRIDCWRNAQHICEIIFK